MAVSHWGGGERQLYLVVHVAVGDFWIRSGIHPVLFDYVLSDLLHFQNKAVGIPGWRQFDEARLSEGGISESRWGSTKWPGVIIPLTAEI